METSLWMRGCASKKRYSNKTFAKKVLKSAKRRLDKKMAIYKCKYCEGFHLTSKVREE
jgi:hypothetical protein